MILTLAILSACSITPPSPENTPPELFSKLNNNSAFFLKKAELESERKNLAWQFVAVQALITEKESTLANSIIEYLQGQPLTTTQKMSLTLLTANNLYAQNELDAAQKALAKVDKKQLSEIGLIYLLKLQTQLHIDKEEHLNASESLFLLNPLLKTDEEKQQYNELLLTQLSLLPIEFLNQYQASLTELQQATSALDFAEQQLDAREYLTEKDVAPVDPFKQGWYALASLYQRYQLRPNQLIRSLNEWQEHYPAHPVLSFMPAQLTDLPELSPYQPENIAVLIPLSGRFKPQGQAIQYGLLHAFYKQQHSRKHNEQAPGSATLNLHFYDTQSQSAEQIVAQFKEQNIDFVIGPLLKNKIEAFLPLAEKMPVLTLNSFPKLQLKDAPGTENKQIAWHYAFPLSPEEEAKQAAQLIFLKEHKKPLLLAPDSSYGKRIAQAFNQQWAALTANSQSQIETYFFEDKAKLAPFIAQALQTDKSKRRIEQMRVITGLPLKTELRSRRDIDAIYIISKRDELLMLKPFIDVATSPFAATIPLYASSRSHLRDQQNKELSKLVFSDSPFLLDNENTTFKEVQQAWKKQSFATLRLFALGFDSYQLIGQLIQLQNTENYTHNGLIGQLSLDASNTVQAKLSWAKYRQGKLIEITPPASAD